MSIVKDLALIAMFLYLAIRYILLYRDMLKQREYFINTLSHDLRVSTIAQIRGLDLLQKDLSETDKNIELVQEINNSCKFTLEMMTMLVNIYKFENGDQILNFDKSPIGNIVKKVIKSLEEEATQKSLRINYTIQENSTVYIDKQEIKKMIYLILSTVICNAQKNSSIDVLLSSENQKCRTKITYEGLSLTDEEYNRMFLKNTRFSTVGHGIKMHLCKKIIDFHKGHISYEKIEKNKNSFVFELPIYKQGHRLKSNFMNVYKPINYNYF